MKTALRFLLPILVVGGSILFVRWMLENREVPRRLPQGSPVTAVKATRLEPTSYQIIVESRGTVEPKTRSTLIPEVAGVIVEVAPIFQEGEFFEKNDLLLRIDPTNYEVQRVVAQRNLAQAVAVLEEEKARAAQALGNWRRLGKTGTPGPLVLREPQLAEAEARVAAAEAELLKAEKDVERTEIRAPYPGLIETKFVDVGQYVAPGTVLAEAFAVDYVEVKLPLSSKQLAFANLPESFRETAEQSGVPHPEVVLTGELGGQRWSWKGYIERVAAAFDRRSRQLFAVAHVDDPYQRTEDGSPPLKIGLFVEAEIVGRQVDNVFVIPLNAIRPDGEVILVDESSTMRRRVVQAIWRDRTAAIVPVGEEGGLQVGEILCLTPIAFPADGAPVTATVDGVPFPPKAAEGRLNGPRSQRT